MRFYVLYLRMAELFSMDAVDLIRLRKVYKRMPKAFKRAAAGTLTAFAFGTRRAALGVLDDELIIRNNRFIEGSMQVERADGRDSFARMEAEMGSIRRPRFSGLVEQELGTTPERNRVFTGAAREGNMRAQTKGWARLKPNAKYPSPETADLGGLTGSKRIAGFMHMLTQKRAGQTFILRKRFGKFKRGLYRIKAGVIKKLQEFDTRGKPRRVRWLTRGRERFFATANIAAIWAKNLDFQLRKLR
jgi:hypothetical protein